ncbi:MAG TPA: type VI secretion system accessory protein TagJ [Blastocatellia bacterium]|nr:type VI secretion system accessory protein TagJ [Blastocatellia bacterium]
MTTAKELFEAGRLQAAIDEVTNRVKANPNDTQQRILLFELLLFAGEWDRAERHADVIAHQSMEAGLGVQVYRNNIKSERDRSRLFSDGLRPHFIGDPPAYVELHLSAINRIREGNIAEARETLDRAEEDRPAFAGAFNGQRFSDFRDYNDVVGPVLEAIVQDQYTWIPFEQITSLEIEAPKQLRDLVWTSARIETTDGTSGEIYIHTLYEGSGLNPSDLVRLGRMTDWKDAGADLYLASGLRLFLIDGEDRALLDARRIEFEYAARESEMVASLDEVSAS